MPTPQVYPQINGTSRLSLECAFFSFFCCSQMLLTFIAVFIAS